MPLDTFLATQEAILNGYLNLDPKTPERLASLSGKTVKIEWALLDHYWLFRSDTIYLTKDYNGQVDLELSGSTVAFIQTVLMKKDAAVVAIPLKISGDMLFAEQFRNLFSNLVIDWEEQLSRLLGDTIAYSMACFLRGMSEWAKQSTENFNRSLTDSIQAGSWLVSKEELQILSSDVDDLRDHVERLEARIQYLQKNSEL